MTETNPSSEQNPQVTNLSQVDVETVNAQLVRMHQSSAGLVTSEDVDMTMSAVAQAKVTNLKLTDSGIAALHADTATVQNSVVGVAQTTELALNGVAGAVVAGSVEFGNAYAGIVAGREVRAERIESLILLSPNVQGNVTTVMDTRGAIIAGLISGLFAGIMLLLGRMLFGKK
ncbi:MAG TPA: hypothetical protein PLG52_05820 [Anaerolineales bacterium]|nr:hypothetical protein [Anaerolineales bacterium]